MPLPAALRRRIGARLRRRQTPAIVAAALISVPLAGAPAAAFNLLATHEVTAQFATADGKPMANAEVRVFAPGAPETPAATGRTDAAGKFVFDADRDGMWSAEASTSSEVARVTIRVGGDVARRGWFSPFALWGVLVVLLVAGLWYRLRRLRRPPQA